MIRLFDFKKLLIYQKLRDVQSRQKVLYLNYNKNSERAYLAKSIERD